MKNLRKGIVPVVLLALALASLERRARGEEDLPVSSIPAQAFRIASSRGPVEVPYERSADWSHPLPEVTRAVILIHGLKRNVGSAYRTLERAAGEASGPARATLLIAPQFLNEKDALAYRLPADLLRWHGNSWESGEPATAPATVSSFEVLDALVEILCDRARFPNLVSIVLAGHSGGGQMIQRYAVVGKADRMAAAKGIRVRYVVANPSSYLYFSEERPVSGSPPFGFQRFPAKDCRGFNRWKYGTENAPPYVAAGSGWTQIEGAYARRDVIYLLGAADTDPHHVELDQSCGGEAEGPTRFSRGQAYYAYLHARHSEGWNQRLRFVPGVAHSADGMFTSQCGVASLFDRGRCQDQ